MEKLIFILEVGSDFALIDEGVMYAMSRTLSPTMVEEYQLQLPDKTTMVDGIKNLLSGPLEVGSCFRMMNL